MAILESRTKTGISWVTESVALFKTAPRKWMLLALPFVSIFMMLPRVPVIQFLTIILMPFFSNVAVAVYRNADMKKQQTMSEIFTNIKPKIWQLIALGVVCLLYGLLIGFLMNDDIDSLSKFTQTKGAMTQSQPTNIMHILLPPLLKLTLLFIPLTMATWFSPMLITFNNYSLVKAIKSSIAGSIQYMFALGTAWLLLSIVIITLILLVGIVASIIGTMVPALWQTLMSIIVFSSFLFATALTLAFQYVSYRDVFRAA